SLVARVVAGENDRRGRGRHIVGKGKQRKPRAGGAAGQAPTPELVASYADPGFGGLGADREYNHLRATLVDVVLRGIAARRGRAACCGPPRRWPRWWWRRESHRTSLRGSAAPARLRGRAGSSGRRQMRTVARALAASRISTGAAKSVAPKHQSSAHPARHERG